MRNKKMPVRSAGFPMRDLMRAGSVLAMLCTPFRAYADQAHPVVGFAIRNVDAFNVQAEDGAKRIVEAAAGTLLLESAQEDAAKQATQLTQFVNRKVDVIVVAEIDARSLAEPIAAARKAGIPVVAVNQSIPPDDRRMLTAYVGADDVEAGRAVARCVIKALSPGKTDIAILRGADGDAPARDRTAGIQEVLAQHPEIHAVASETARWNRTLGFNRGEDWLKAYGTGLGGIIAENDSMGQGAVQALEEQDLDGHIPVCAVDGTPAAIALVQKRAMTATMLQNGLLEYGEAVQIGLDALAGRPHPDLALLKLPMVSAETVGAVRSQMVDNRQAFLDGLPALVRRDLDSGDYANQ